MQSLVLEKTNHLSLRPLDVDEPMGARDVRIKVHTVGICGSDVHYYQHGRIGPFVVNAPMILGHEASGTVSEVGSAVTSLKPGDRVCMEPGIPDLNGRATRLGMYNLDPAVRFWATPPVHGCLRPEVVHPAAFTFKVPDNVSFAEAAMVEPLAVGMHAANKANVKPGDVAVVTGAGPIGMVTALAALAAGCSRVVMSDVQQPKLDLAAKLVIAHRAAWAGQHYGALVPAAEALEHDHPVAATVLYRALLDDILARARSPAYGHGTRYLARLDALESEGLTAAGLIDHESYRAGLRRTHGRKAAFWSIVDGAD